MLSYISTTFWYTLGYTNKHDSIDIDTNEMKIKVLNEKVKTLEEIVINLNPQKKYTRKNRKRKRDYYQQRLIDDKNYIKLCENQKRRLASNEVYDLEIIPAV